jgi:hypothetical protein
MMQSHLVATEGSTKKDGLAEHFDDEDYAKKLKAESQVSVHRNMVTIVDHCDDLLPV